MTVSWDDEGIVLDRRRYQETALWVSCFTFEHGRHAGWVPGGASSAQRALFEPGNRVQLHWQARLADQLGRFRAEPLDLAAGRLLDHGDRLMALRSALTLVETGTAEREAHPRLYAALVAFIRKLSGETPWRGTYLRFELLLLADTGFALDLERCAVTGAEQDLAFVSPRTGRAVARGAAPEYEARLLPLPACLIEGGEPDDEDFVRGLRLTAHFLERQLYHVIDRPAPAARVRLAQLAEEMRSRGVEPPA